MVIAKTHVECQNKQHGACAGISFVFPLDFDKLCSVVMSKIPRRTSKYYRCKSDLRDRTDLTKKTRLSRLPCWSATSPNVLPGAITCHTLDTKSLFSLVLNEVSWVSFY